MRNDYEGTGEGAALCRHAFVGLDRAAQDGVMRLGLLPTDLVEACRVDDAETENKVTVMRVAVPEPTLDEWDASGLVAEWIKSPEADHDPKSWTCVVRDKAAHLTVVATVRPLNAGEAIARYF